MWDMNTCNQLLVKITKYAIEKPNKCLKQIIISSNIHTYINDIEYINYKRFFL